VDCLSRVGMFDEAQQIINDYEKSNLPSLIMYRDDKLVQEIRENRIKEFGNKVKAAFSWTEVNGQLVNKTIHMYGAMFKGYILNNMPEKVIELFEKISIEIDEVIIIMLFNACAKLCNSHAIQIGNNILKQLPSSFLHHQKLVNSAIDMLMKFGDVNQAEFLFKKIQNKTLVTYGAIMQGYLINNLFDKVLDVFEKIPLKPNEVLYSIFYNACASLSNEKSIQIGKKYFNQMPTIYLNDIVLTNSAIHMFMKFNEIGIAESLFSKMKKRTLYTYGVMINGYNINEEPQKCLLLFEQMKKENLTINEPISISLIGACSQIGIRSISENIVNQISHLSSNSYLNNSLIDMWGKSSDINQARKIFQSIIQPDIIAYNSMINAYARNGMGYEAIDLYYQMS
ncbi:unnamed protein product, partial [Rotaria sp. Silwood1]